MSIKKVWLVAQRDLARFWRYKYWLAGQVAMNLADIVIFGLIFRGIVNPAYINDYVKFITPGVLSLSIFISAFSIGREVGVELRREVTHYLVSLPLKRGEFALGRIMGGVLRGLIYQVGFAIFASLILSPPPLERMPLFLYTSTLLAITMSSISISFSTITRDFSLQATIRSLTYYVMFFVSNIFYPQQVIAMRLGPFAFIADYSPLTMATNIYRYCFRYIETIDVAFNALGLLIWTAFIAMAAYKLYMRNLVS